MFYSFRLSDFKKEVVSESIQGGRGRNGYQPIKDSIKFAE